MALIESTEDPIWSVSADGRLIAFNRAFARRVERTSAVCVAAGMEAEVCLPSTEELPWSRLYARALAEGFFRRELTFPDGQSLEFAFNPIVIDGEKTGVSIFTKDLTDHKAAEQNLAATSEALRECEERYHATFEQAAVGIVHASFDGVYLRCNARFAEIIGYPLEEIPGMTFQQITAREDFERSEMMRRQIASAPNGSLTLEKRYLRKDGSLTWVAVTASAQLDAEGRPLYSIALVRDINARKAAEERLSAASEALRKSEERYRATFEQAAVGIVHTSLGGRFLRCNARFAEIVGYTQEEVSELTFQQITPAEDLDESLAVPIRLTKGEIDTASWEKRYIRKDGNLTCVNLTMSAQRDDEGQVLHYIALVEDINARKIAEDALATATKSLRASETLYRTAFQTSPDAIALARISDGVYLEVNQAFLDFAGYERDEVVGKSSRELSTWADLRDRDTWIAALRANSICRNLDFPFIKKNGEIFWGRLTSAIVEIDGVPCTYTSVHDISETRAAEARLAAAAEALRSSEAHYRTVFETSVDGIAISQMSDGRYIDVNKAFLDLMGYEREEVIGQTSLELNFWVDPEIRSEMVRTLREDKGFRDMQTQYLRKGGETVWISVSASAIEIEGTPCILSIVRDISEAKAAEQRLAAAQQAQLASEARYTTAFQTSLDAVNINRLSDGVYLDCNQAFLDILGFEREEVIGRSSLELDIWVNLSDRKKMADILLHTKHCQGLEAQFRKKNGEVIWGQMSASAMDVDGVPCILSITRDVTDAKTAETEIRDLAFYDTLTRLPNRRLMWERLRQTLAASARNNRNGALLFIDLDNFKTLNDTLGHKMGDHLLQEVARRLSGCTREADTVARLGGDEFVVILEDLSETAHEAAAHAKTVAEKILNAIGMPYLLGDHVCLSACSIGITVFGDKKESIDDLLQQADIAMYQAKAAGRNTLRFFAPALQTAINARASTEDDLRQAIGTNQFQLYYQPQIESGVLTGAEALLRWNHPVRGFLPPNDFIPLAEETGLILILGDWVLETACKQIASWAKRKETERLSIAVNISARQLRQPEFVEQVLNVLYRTGANPKNLKLEITESMLVDDVEEVIAKMSALKSHGLSFSLDDFGTGYSSLSYLKSLPLDQLKIDRVFVRDMLVDPTSAAIAQTIISLSLAMGLSVIAEGVETEEQRQFLAGHGCHSYQGYLFSPAVPLEKFQRLLQNSGGVS